MPARILIVEDNRDNLGLMHYLLAAHGHTPLAATSGSDGIDAAAAEGPDLILMDIQMPEMDGFEAAEAIRGQGGRVAPIVAVTAFAMVGDRQRVVESRLFDGYITKPISPETFVGEVESYLPAPLRAGAPGAAGWSGGGR